MSRGFLIINIKQIKMNKIVKFDEFRYRKADADVNNNEEMCVMVFGERTLGFVHNPKANISSPEEEDITYLIDEWGQENEDEVSIVIEVDLAYSFSLINQCYEVLGSGDKLSMEVQFPGKDIEEYIF